MTAIMTTTTVIADKIARALRRHNHDAHIKRTGDSIWATYLRSRFDEVEIDFDAGIIRRYQPTGNVPLRDAHPLCLADPSCFKQLATLLNAYDINTPPEWSR